MNQQNVIDLSKFCEPEWRLKNTATVIRQISLAIRDWEWTHYNLNYDILDTEKWVNRANSHAEAFWMAIQASPEKREKDGFQVIMSLTRSEFLLAVGNDTIKGKAASEPPLKSQTANQRLADVQTEVETSEFHDKPRKLRNAIVIFTNGDLRDVCQYLPLTLDYYAHSIGRYEPNSEILIKT